MKSSSLFHRYKELLLGAAMIALAVFYLYYSTGIRTRSSVAVSAKLIPEILGVIVLILGTMQIVQGIRYLVRVRRQDAAEGNQAVAVSTEEKRDIMPILLTFVLIVAYAVAFEPLGFIVSSALCMFFQTMLLAPRGQRRPLLFAVIACAVSVTVYIAFRKGLDLSLPAGILESVFI